MSKYSEEQQQKRKPCITAMKVKWKERNKELRLRKRIKINDLLSLSSRRLDFIRLIVEDELKKRETNLLTGGHLREDALQVGGRCSDYKFDYYGWSRNQMIIAGADV